MTGLAGWPRQFDDAPHGTWGFAVTRAILGGLLLAVVLIVLGLCTLAEVLHPYGHPLARRQDNQQQI